jgi:hypothetical protein
VIERAPLATSTVAGSKATRYDTWIRGWVRNTVSTLMSSCEWWSSWKRHSMRTRWFARCTIQLHPSIATTIRAITPQRGTTPIRGNTIHGATARATCTDASVSAVTRGTISVAFNTVKITSWRWPRANSGRCWAGHTRSTTRNTPMSTSVKGPATTARSAVTEPPKSAPPHPVAQPTEIRTAAIAVIENAGR